MRASGSKTPPLKRSTPFKRSPVLLELLSFRYCCRHSRSIMFANLGLFARYRCPQQDCGRSKCMFAHVDQRPSKSIDPVPPSKKPRTTQLAPPPATSSTQPTRRASVMTSSFSTVSPSSTASAVHSKVSFADLIQHQTIPDNRIANC